jgi:hypothetical protein
VTEQKNEVVQTRKIISFLYKGGGIDGSESEKGNRPPADQAEI